MRGRIHLLIRHSTGSNREGVNVEDLAYPRESRILDLDAFDCKKITLLSHS